MGVQQEVLGKMRMFDDASVRQPIRIYDRFSSVEEMVYVSEFNCKHSSI